MFNIYEYTVATLVDRAILFLVLGATLSCVMLGAGIVGATTFSNAVALAAWAGLAFTAAVIAFLFIAGIRAMIDLEHAIFNLRPKQD